MKQKKHHILFLLLALNLLCFSKIEVNAWPAGDGDSNWNVEAVKTYNDFQYMYMPETDSIAVVGYVGNNEVVVVPGEIDGKPVKEIVGFNDYTNFNWYQPNPSIKEIYVSEGILCIGGFHNCINVEKVHLPNSVQVIGADAFENCKNLKEVVWSANLVKIERGAFAGCIKLKKVNLPYGIKEIGSFAFARCYSLKQISIPDSVVEIGEEAFFACSKLSKVKLSKNLTVIKRSSFHACNIKSVQIPNKVKRIEEEAFAASNLKQIKLPSSLIYIESSAFAANSIKEIIIPSKVKSIGYQAFAHCKQLKKITIKSTNVKKISKGAFYNIHKNATFNVPNKQIRKYKKMLIAGNNFNEKNMKIR